MHRRQQRQVARLEPIDSGVLVRAGVDFAKRHYVLSTSWIVGLLLGAFFAGFSVTAEQAYQFEADLDRISTGPLMQADERLREAYSYYYQSKGWFFTCDATCTRYYDKYQQAQARFDQLEYEYNSQLADAKGKLGVFSEYGVAETRDLFWSKFNNGGKFAKRATTWDALFMGMSAMGRDEGMASFILRLVMRFLMNLTIGMISALIGFLWNVWAVISSFQPTPLEGLAFFGMAALVACSFLITFLVGIYATAAGTVYVVASASNAQRLQNDGQGRQQVNWQQQNYRQQQQQRYQQPRSPPPAYNEYDNYGDNADHVD